MSLTEQLTAVSTRFNAAPASAFKDEVLRSRAEFVSSFDPKSAIQVGDKLPEFTLKNATGKETSSSKLLADGPILITFYRGEWCPFCNLALRAFQKRVADFKAKNVTIVAISPELPDQALTTTEKNELDFEVLSDIESNYAKKLGIVWNVPESMRPVYEAFGHNFKARNGSDSLDVPVPATILVDKSGVVRNVFLDPDYTKRMEPAEALKWVDAL